MEEASRAEFTRLFDDFKLDSLRRISEQSRDAREDARNDAARERTVRMLTITYLFLFPAVVFALLMVALRF